MYVYWFLFAVFALGTVIYRPERRYDRRLPLLLAFVSIIPVLVIGLRYEVGADWNPYLEIFQDIRYLSFLKALRRVDPGYGAINWLAQQLNLRIWAVNLVCGALYVFGLNRFAARQYHPWLVVLVAVPYLTIVVVMGYARQGAALGLILAALAAASERSLVRFLFWAGVASLFHRSALIVVPIVAMTFSQNRLVTIALGGVATVVGLIFIVLPGIDQAVDLYSSGQLESQGVVIRLAMNTVPAVIYLALYRRFPVESDERKMWLYFSLLSLVLDFVQYSFQMSTAIDRIALYLIPLQLFVFANLPYVFSIRERSNNQLVFAVILYSAAILFVWLTFASNAKDWLPYQFFPKMFG